MGVIYGSVSSWSGYGDGSGYGSGYGSGDGDHTYITAVAKLYTPSHVESEMSKGAVVAFWRSGADGCPVNGGTGVARHIGMIEEEPGPLVPCQAGALHATLNPSKWKGERLWVVVLYPPVIKVDDDKFASLKREIIAEIPNWYA